MVMTTAQPAVRTHLEYEEGDPAKEAQGNDIPPPHASSDLYYIIGTSGQVTQPHWLQSHCPPQVIVDSVTSHGRSGSAM